MQALRDRARHSPGAIERTGSPGRNRRARRLTIL